MQTAQRIGVVEPSVNGMRLSPDLNEASGRRHGLRGRRREAKRTRVGDHPHQKVFGAGHVNLTPSVILTQVIDKRITAAATRERIRALIAAKLILTGIACQRVGLPTALYFNLLDVAQRINAAAGLSLRIAAGAKHTR